MSNAYPALLKRFTIRIKRSEKFGFPMIFLKFIFQISIEFWTTNTLLHKFFQTDMIFFDQFNVPSIKIRKYLSFKTVVFSICEPKNYEVEKNCFEAPLDFRLLKCINFGKNVKSLAGPSVV